MKNALLCTVLGIGVVMTAACLDYVNGNIAVHEQLSEKNIYAELDADINRRYSGYNIDELCSGYRSPGSFLGKTEISFPVVNQHPELPTGCEVTCAAAMLNFFGYDIDKCRLTDVYLPISDGSFSEKDGILYGADPHEYFVGDPYGKGYGCYKEVIANVLNRYFYANGSENRAVILDESNQADLERLLDGGVPIIVWASIDMKPYRYNAVSQWITEKGEPIQWLSNSHTLILTGYDASYYYFMDCNNKDDIERYPKETFLKRWNENGKQTIVVKINQ